MTAPDPLQALTDASELEHAPGAQVLVHVLAFDDESRILLGRGLAAEIPSAGRLWALPSTPAVPGRDPDVSARLLAPSPNQRGTVLPGRPVPLGARSELLAVAPTHRIHLLYAVHVPLPPLRPRPDGAAWWGLAEAARLHLSELTRLALALGWHLLPPT